MSSGRQFKMPPRNSPDMDGMAVTTLACLLKRIRPFWSSIQVWTRWWLNCRTWLFLGSSHAHLMCILLQHWGLWHAGFGLHSGWLSAIKHLVLFTVDDNENVNSLTKHLLYCSDSFVYLFTQKFVPPKEHLEWQIPWINFNAKHFCSNSFT